MTRSASVVIVSLAGQDKPELTSDLRRLLPLLRSLGVPYELWGWDAGRFCPLGEGRSRGALAGKIVVLCAYSWWFVRVFFRALRNANRPLYFCVMFEGVLPITLAGLFRALPVVFANMDNAPLNRQWSAPARWTIEHLERFVARRSIFHVVPAPSRWAHPDTNVRIVENAPTRATYFDGVRIAKERGYRRDATLTVYANGWLSDLRGFAVLSEAIRCAKHPIRLLLAGRLACPAARALAESDYCEYLGVLPHDEAIAVYSRAHLVFTYYDPIYEIDRLASSGKWSECVLTKVPFAVNVEVETARKYREADACFSAKYGDAEGLGAIFDRLSEAPAEWERIRANLSRFTVDLWDAKMIGVLRDAGLEFIEGNPEKRV
jgi:hypothetical protein